MAHQETERNAKTAIHGSDGIIFLGSLHIVGLLSSFCNKLWDSVLSACGKSISAVVSAFVLLTGILNYQLFVEADGNRQEVPKSRTTTKSYGGSYGAWDFPPAMNPAYFTPKITAKESRTNQLIPGRRFHCADVETMTIILNPHLCKLRGRDQPNCLQCITTSAPCMSCVKKVNRTVQYSGFRRQKQSVVDLIAAIQYLTFEMTQIPRYAKNQQDAVVSSLPVRFLTAGDSAHYSEVNTAAADETRTGNEVAFFGNDPVEQNEVFAQDNDGYSTGKVDAMYMGWAEQIVFNGETSYRGEDWIAMNENHPVSSEDENCSDTCPLTQSENGNTCDTIVPEAEKYTQHFKSKKQKRLILFRTLKRIFCSCTSCSQLKEKSNGRQANCQEETETLIQMTARNNGREEKFVHEN